MVVYIRGAGDIASGIALRLHEAGFVVVMADVAQPTCIRRTVAFCEAIRTGEAVVEGVCAVRADSLDQMRAAQASGRIAVMVDPKATYVERLAPDVVVDAILAKRNVGTTRDMAPIVIGVGPGFVAGFDCHAAVETKRGHYLGRVLYQGSPIANTGIPGIIAGHGADRVLRAPAEGTVEPVACIGDTVRAGQTVAYVGGVAMTATIDGVLRGLLAPGVCACKGMKAGDVDPRGVAEYCATVSDKARAVAGGVLEAVLHLHRAHSGNDERA